MKVRDWRHRMVGPCFQAPASVLVVTSVDGTH